MAIAKIYMAVTLLHRAYTMAAPVQQLSGEAQAGRRTIAASDLLYNNAGDVAIFKCKQRKNLSYNKV